MAGFTGFVALLISADWLVGWTERCLPADGWSAPGSVFIGLGLAVALTAIGRLIYNRVRVGTAGEPVDDGGATSSQVPSSVESPAGERRRNFPVERRRVVVEYAVTYAVAVLFIVIGAGLA
ncbi:hypothetical protein [Microbacterium oxydans]|uniref:hypothetical protein n=1 Tax=Microbacterium oxydans TaxID=82380 RepID=UPI00366C401E